MNMSENYLTKEKIDDLQPRKFMRVDVGSCGSMFVFKGIARRDKTEKGFVKEIFYEVYEEMAENEIGKVKHDALNKFKVEDIYLKHRIGRVRVGEVSLLVAILSAHRKSGIEAIDYIIDEIKFKVPIWKKEIFEDGSYRWREDNARYKR